MKEAHEQVGLAMQIWEFFPNWLKYLSLLVASLYVHLFKPAWADSATLNASPANVAGSQEEFMASLWPFAVEQLSRSIAVLVGGLLDLIGSNPIFCLGLIVLSIFAFNARRRYHDVC